MLSISRNFLIASSADCSRAALPRTSSARSQSTTWPLSAAHTRSVKQTENALILFDVAAIFAVVTWNADRLFQRAIVLGRAKQEFRPQPPWTACRKTSDPRLPYEQENVAIFKRDPRS